MKPLLEFQVSELITTKTVVKEIEKLLGTYSRTGKIETLIAAQEAVHKVEKTIADAIKSATPAAEDGEELNWDALPIKAPIFVLNLAKKYPQKEQKYYEAWKAIITKHAPAPGEKANYGKYINMFKHYARRPEYELALEDVDFDAEIAKYNDVNEENDKPTNESKITGFKRIKMFEDFEDDDDDDDSDNEDSAPYYFFVGDGEDGAIVKIGYGKMGGGGSYREFLVRGKEPYGFGSKTYQSYLSADDIEEYLRKDYGYAERINSEDEFDNYIPEEK